MSVSNEDLTTEGVIEIDHVIVTEETGQEIDREITQEIVEIEIESHAVNVHVRKKETKRRVTRGRRAQ